MLHGTTLRPDRLDTYEDGAGSLPCLYFTRSRPSKTPPPASVPGSALALCTRGNEMTTARRW
eukprot:356293-Chlamydomonas_euryale.AAC.4